MKLKNHDKIAFPITILIIIVGTLLADTTEGFNKATFFFSLLGAIGFYYAASGSRKDDANHATTHGKQDAHIGISTAGFKNTNEKLDAVGTEIKELFNDKFDQAINNMRATTDTVVNAKPAELKLKPYNQEVITGAGDLKAQPAGVRCAGTVIPNPFNDEDFVKQVRQMLIEKTIVMGHDTLSKMFETWMNQIESQYKSKNMAQYAEDKDKLLEVISNEFDSIISESLNP